MNPPSRRLKENYWSLFFLFEYSSDMGKENVKISNTYNEVRTFHLCTKLVFFNACHQNVDISS